jgi:hypothetical protein
MELTEATAAAVLPSVVLVGPALRATTAARAVQQVPMPVAVAEVALLLAELPRLLLPLSEATVVRHQ